jgi:hypothetical protein
MSLDKAGGVKKCAAGDIGRGPDNDRPWYYAVYEMKGGRDEAAAEFISIAKDNGYTLTDNSAGVNVEDDLLYADKTSKQSPYSQLASGNVNLLVDVYGSKTHNGKNGYLCGVTKNDNPPKDKTTIRFTINLPESKR